MQKIRRRRRKTGAVFVRDGAMRDDGGRGRSSWPGCAKRGREKNAALVACI